jgi:hypothetical protein
MSYWTPWYTSEQSRSVMLLQAGQDGLQVPRNVAGFRRFRDSQGATATMGVMMTLVLCSFPATLIYISAVDPSAQNPAARHMAFFFCAVTACMTVFLGLGAYPALQRSKEVNRVLKQNLPALVVTHEGIWDYCSSYVFGFVSWEEIEKVMLDNKYSPETKKYWPGISFIAKNKDVLLRRKSPLARFWLNKESTIADRRQIFIPQEWIDVPIKDLITQIEALHPKKPV